MAYAYTMKAVRYRCELPGSVYEKRLLYRITLLM